MEFAAGMELASMGNVNVISATILQPIALPVSADHLWIQSAATSVLRIQPFFIPMIPVFRNMMILVASRANR